MKRFLSGLCSMFILSVCAHANAAELNADFKDASKWELSDKWQLSNGTAIGSAKTTSMLFVKDIPSSSSMSLEAEITPRKAMSEHWKTSGICIFMDKDNFWTFNLGEAPDTMDKKHYVELKSMCGGNWEAERRLGKPSAFYNTGFSWEYNTKYKMILSISADSVNARLFDEGGTLLSEIKYQLDKDAVKEGKPALRIVDSEAEFSKLFIKTAN